MSREIPGTVLTMPDGTQGDPYGVLEPLIGITGGLTLSQIVQITGLKASTIQNWVKRGWVENPKGKRYREQQLVRILLINMLRGTMLLEQIVELMTFINGRVDDRSDDIIPDRRLYSFLCSVSECVREGEYGDTEKIRQAVEHELSDYVEPVVGARKRLEDSLTVMVLACQAAKIKNKTAEEFMKLNIERTE